MPRDFADDGVYDYRVVITGEYGPEEGAYWLPDGGTQEITYGPYRSAGIAAAQGKRYLKRHGSPHGRRLSTTFRVQKGTTVWEDVE
jgi:hypothetical protein